MPTLVDAAQNLENADAFWAECETCGEFEPLAPDTEVCAVCALVSGDWSWR